MAKMYIAERDKRRILEFFELSDKNYNLRKYTKPVLVYTVEDDLVKYSIFEEDILNRYGLENVDGYDHTENVAFCPDWMRDDIDDFDDDIDLDDDEL
jgi:glutathionyl-hydroquinone reductase